MSTRIQKQSKQPCGPITCTVSTHVQTCNPSFLATCHLRSSAPTLHSCRVTGRRRSSFGIVIQLHIMDHTWVEQNSRLVLSRTRAVFRAVLHTGLLLATALPVKRMRVSTSLLPSTLSRPPEGVLGKDRRAKLTKVRGQSETYKNQVHSPWPSGFSSAYHTCFQCQ